MMIEEWKPLRETDKYEASNEGRIRATKTGRIMKTQIDEQGRETLTIVVNGKKCHRRVARLIAEAFYGATCDGLEVYHYDGDLLNNYLDNLRIGTRTDSVRNSFRTGRHRATVIGVRVVETGEVFNSIGECGRAVGMSMSAVSKSLNGKQVMNQKGLHFERVD